MTNPSASFFEELKRRSVIRVGVAYLVVAWLIAQVADLGLDAFEAPAWVMQSVLLVLVLGFPVALFLAWVFELTPEGIKHDAEVDHSGLPASAKGRRLDLAIIGLLSVALLYFLVTHEWGGGAGVAGDSGPKSIAVLPFENLSDSQENAFFASGVHEDILTYLAKVADLHVISRASVRQFADGRRDIEAIADKLGVENIVEGSVRRAGNTVRVTAQLIDVRTGAQVWAENYDRDLANVFEIQTAVAREIVAALQAQLSAEERTAINNVPTRNIEAYDRYAQARAMRRNNAYANARMLEAESLLLEAVALDPDFAVAYAMLGSVHTNIYWQDIDLSEERLRRAKAAIDRAFELQPDLPEARAALAEYYYRGFSNYTRALREIETAHEQYPNNTEILELMGVLQRRLGQWDESIQSLRAATQLDPTDFSKRHALLETMVRAHEWESASAYGDELLIAYPDDDSIVAMRANTYVSGYGNVDAAARLLADRGIVLDVDHLYLNLLLAWISGDYDRALALLDEYRPVMQPFPPGTREFVLSWTYAFKGEDERAREYAALSIEGLSAIADTSDPNVSSWTMLNAESYVRIGQPEEGLRIARAVLAANPLDGDAFTAPGHYANAARIMAMAGEVDEGLDTLAIVLDKPGGPTSWDIRLLPVWNFLRGNPRFAAMIGTEPETG